MTPSSALRRRRISLPCLVAPRRMVGQVYPWSPTLGRGERLRPDHYHPAMWIQDQWSVLRAVYVRPPEPAAMERWRGYGWRAAPDPARAAAEHEAFRAVLAGAGADVIVGATPAPDDPDAIYVYDPVLMTDDGAVLLHPAKEGRRDEPAVASADLEAAGIPVVAALGDAGEPAFAEGGDLCWLDRRTLLAGVGYRTTTEGLDALRGLLPDVTVVAFDLPHLSGPAACTHLLSFLSILDRDLGWRRSRICPSASWSCSVLATSASWRCRRKSSTRWVPTCSHSGPDRPGGRGQPRDPPPHGVRRGGRADLCRRGDLAEGGRRPDLPHETVAARMRLRRSRRPGAGRCRPVADRSGTARTTDRAGWDAPRARVGSRHRYRPADSRS